MNFILSFCLAVSERECKGIIYYNPFRICQMLHVLCNYHTFGKLFLPTHMLGKSSNCGRETFLLFERNSELHLGLQDLCVLLSSLGLILPRNPELAHLPPWEAELSVLCFTHTKTAVALDHFTYQTATQMQYNQSKPSSRHLQWLFQNASARCVCTTSRSITITSDQVHYLKQNKRTPTSRTPPQTQGQSAGHYSFSQGPAHTGRAVLLATTLDLSPQAEKAPPRNLNSNLIHRM